MTVVVLALTIAAVCAAALGLGKLAWDRRRERAVDEHDLVINRYQDLRVTPDRLLVGPFDGARAAALIGVRAMVLTGDQIAARETTGQHVPELDVPINPRTVYLIAEGPDITVVREVSLRSRVTDIAAAYRFASALNLRATALDQEYRASQGASQR